MTTQNEQSDSLILLLLASTVILGVLYWDCSQRLIRTQAQLQVEQVQRQRLEATISGMLMSN